MDCDRHVNLKKFNSILNETYFLLHHHLSFIYQGTLQTRRSLIKSRPRRRQ